MRKNILKRKNDESLTYLDHPLAAQKKSKQTLTSTCDAPSPQKDPIETLQTIESTGNVRLDNEDCKYTSITWSPKDNNWDPLVDLLLDMNIPLIQAEQECPGLIQKISQGIYRGFVTKKRQVQEIIANSLQSPTHDQLLTVEAQAPGTAKGLIAALTTPNQEALDLHIEASDETTTQLTVQAETAVDPESLTPLTHLIESISLEKLLEIEKKSPGFVLQTVQAATKGFPKILSAALPRLSEVSLWQLCEIEHCANYTIHNLVNIGLEENLPILVAMTKPLSQIKKQQISFIEEHAPGTVAILAKAASITDSPATPTIASIIEKLDTFDFLQIIEGTPTTLQNIIDSSIQSPQTLNACIKHLQDLSTDELIKIESLCPGTIFMMTDAACSYPDALNALCKPLQELTTTQFETLLEDSKAAQKRNPQTPKTYLRTRTITAAIYCAITYKTWEPLKKLAPVLQKHFVSQLEELATKVPRIFFMILSAAIINEHSNNCDAATHQLRKLSLKQIIQLEKIAPKTIFTIALTAENGYKKGFAAIQNQLKKLTQYQWQEIENHAPKTQQKVQHLWRTIKAQSAIETPSQTVKNSSSSSSSSSSSKIVIDLTHETSSHKTDYILRDKAQKPSLAPQPQVSQTIDTHTIFNSVQHRHQPNPTTTPSSTVPPQANTAQRHSEHTAGDRQSPTQYHNNQRRTPAQNTQQVDAPRCLIL